MLNQNSGRYNLPAYLKGVVNFRDGCIAIPVFCCPSFLNVGLFHQQNSVFFSSQNLARFSASVTSAFFVCLMTVMAIVIGASNVLAAERILLGNVGKSPLSASSDSNVIKTISILRQQVNARGRARVIVGLRVPFAAEGTMDAASVAQQRNEIARMQDEVLEIIPSLKLRSESIKRYSGMPFMALVVNAAELEALLILPEITSVEVDSIAVPLLKME